VSVPEASVDLDRRAILWEDHIGTARKPGYMKAVILLLPEEFRINGTEMRVSTYGKKAILLPVKKKRDPVQVRRGLTSDFRETVRARAKRDPAFRALIGRYVPLKRRKQIKKRAPKI